MLNTLVNKTLICDRKGQVLVEFALLWPVLALCFVLMLTFGFYLTTQQMVTAAAAQGARQGAITNSNTEIKDAVGDNTKVLGKGNVDVTIWPSTRFIRMRGQPIEVTVEYRLPRIFWDAGVPAKMLVVKSKAVRYIECDTNKSPTRTCSMEPFGGVVSKVQNVLD